MKAYLHFGTGTEPRQTIAVPARETPSPRYGLSMSGYGAQIPTRHMVRWENRWRRVYVAVWGNSGTAYIGKPGAWLATVSLD